MTNNNLALFVRYSIAAAILALISFLTAHAQSTLFTLQGRLNDGGLAANASYDMQFKLFPAASGGAQAGPTQTVSNVAVSNGIFTVRLDFGAVFDGSDRYVEIGVRPAGSNAAYTILTPRVPVTTAPYSIQANSALNAATATTASDSSRLGGILAAQYVQSNDTRLSDPRSPTAGSANYIQNGLATQPNSSFNISGDGTVGGTVSGNVVDTRTDFRMSGAPVFRLPGGSNMFIGRNAGVDNQTGGSNTFVGQSSGQLNVDGNYNTFVGAFSGFSNLSGTRNSFFGNSAGVSTVDGRNNSIFGANAGVSNSSGSFNSFFGAFSGTGNTTGTSNAFFGYQSGFSNVGGAENSFVGNLSGYTNTSGLRNSGLGASAGVNNLTGSNNVFVGFNSGNTNTTESNNTFVGFNATGAAGVNNATAIGAGATVTQSDTMVLGTNAVTVVAPGNLTVNGTLTANLPSGSANYIQNTSTPQANAEFNVSGNGRVGGTFTAGLIALNDGMLRIRGAGDTSQGIRYDGVVDGVEFRAFGGFRWNYGFSGATEGMRFTSGGFLGIGNDSPTERLSVGGNGTFSGKVVASNFSAANEYQIGGITVLKAYKAANLTFVGSDAGTSINGGIQNTFLGSLTGKSTTTGNFNTFAGTGAGMANTTGSQNTYFGNGAGQSSITVDGNSFFGYGAGFQTTAGDNSFFGNRSGIGATTGVGNSFFGSRTGEATTGSQNSFFGAFAGLVNTTGQTNVFLGTNAGVTNTAGSQNSFLGTGAGFQNTTGNSNIYIGYLAGAAATNESNNTVIGTNSNIAAGVSHSTAIGAGAVATASNQVVLGSNTDQVVMPGLVSGGQTNLCTNGSKVILMCSSSLRFKTNIRPYSRSLEVISKLRPIAFDWKDGGMKDVGFGAEDVAKIDPLLVTYDDKGAVVGVKYDRLSTVFVNAFREQQDQIARQQGQISSQKTLIDEQRRKLSAQDEAIASLGRRLEQLAQRVERRNPGRRVPARGKSRR